MRSPIVLALLMVMATPLAAQENAAANGHGLPVSDKITVTDGEEIYRTLCQGCHQPDGAGATGAGDYPALADNPHLEFPGYAVSLVLNGQRAMPPFGAILDNGQIAAVVRFIQTNWGNEAAETASTDLVEDLRQ